MTTEIAVLNKQAVALAADSAGTLSGGERQKIFAVNKIFALSKYEPIGVMVYGAAEFMGIPWETIIKIYRGKLGQTKFKTVSGYAEDFLVFLRQNDLLFSESDAKQDEYVHNAISWYFRRIHRTYVDQVVKELSRGASVDESTPREDIAATVIQKEHDLWNQADIAPTAPANFADEFFEQYGGILDRALEEILEGISLTDESFGQLMKIAVNLFLKFPSGMITPTHSGVVFAGFGTEDVFPVLEAFTVEGRIGDYLKQRRDEKNCARIGVLKNAVVLPFAQREMVDTFMSGIDPMYQRLVEKSFGDLRNSIQQITLEDVIQDVDDPEEYIHGPELRSEMEEEMGPYWPETMDAIGNIIQTELNRLLESLSEHRKAMHIAPIMSVVEWLPKDEMAVMAETLIHLTSLKRRVSMEAETVGGPIDVAVISKGDGFVWIKRKNYFEGDANPQFFADYYR